jgi:hypothetical protein
MLLLANEKQFRTHETDRAVLHNWEWPPPPHQVPQRWNYKLPTNPKPEGPELKSEMLMDLWNGHSMVPLEGESQTTGHESRLRCPSIVRGLIERWRGQFITTTSVGRQKIVCLPHWTFDSTPKRVERRFALLESHTEPLKGWGVHIEEGFKISWEMSLFFLLVAFGAVGLAVGLEASNENLAYLGVAGLPLPVLGYILTIYLTAGKDNKI